MKKKLIALTMASAVMLMGAGYAQWTDQLKVANTVTTGDMNVEFFTQAAAAWDDKYMSAGITPTADNKSETVSITGMYPGSVAVYAGGIENKGTIPAQVQGVTVALDTKVSTNSAALATKMGFIAGYIVMDKDGNLVPSKAGFTYGMDLNTLQSKLQGLLNVTLEPGEKLYFDIPEANKPEAVAFMPQYANLKDNCFVFGLPISVTNADKLENESLKFDLTVNFGQSNGTAGDNATYSPNLDNSGTNTDGTTKNL